MTLRDVGAPRESTQLYHGHGHGARAGGNRRGLKECPFDSPLVFPNLQVEAVLSPPGFAQF